MDFQEIIYRLLVSAIPLFMGMVLHELAHAYAAYSLGDNTAKDLGRLTLNPIAHIDQTGLMFYVLTALFSPFVFGWAKPVPVNPRRFTKINNVKTGMLIVSLAGPMTNFLLAIAFGFALKLYLMTVSSEFLVTSVGYFINNMLAIGIGLNLVLAILNLLPIPPLDGSHILSKFLPYPLDYKFMSIGRYGTVLLMILLVTDILSTIIQFFIDLLFPIVLFIIQLQ